MSTAACGTVVVVDAGRVVVVGGAVEPIVVDEGAPATVVPGGADVQADTVTAVRRTNPRRVGKRRMVSFVR
jgi:hypothetical protein